MSAANTHGGGSVEIAEGRFGLSRLIIDEPVAFEWQGGQLTVTLTPQMLADLEHQARSVVLDQHMREVGGAA